MDELEPVFETVSRYFTLLSEPMRVRILHAICQRAKTVSEIVAETGASQTNVSRHLGTMHRAGVLTRRKVGNFTFYGVGDPTLTELCRTVCVQIAARDEPASRSRLMAFARELAPAEPGVAPAEPKVAPLEPGVAPVERNEALAEPGVAALAAREFRSSR